MKHKLRRGIDLALTALGIALIITAVILGSSLEISAQLPLVLIGVLLMEAGIWGVSVKFLPNDRRYNSLRSEGDRMLALIRDLNTAAIAKDRGEEDAGRFQDCLRKMHDSVTRMADLAAQDDLEQEASGNSRV
jgi:hypothetical protein